MRPHVVCLLLSFRPVSFCLSVITFWWLFYCNIVFLCRKWEISVLLESFENSICNLLETKKCDKTNKPISQKWIGVFLTKERLCVVCLRGDKESWIRSKYVEKKFIHKLPETGRNTLLRRSSARRNRTTTHDRSMLQRPPLKPKPNRATLPRLTGRRDGETHSICWVTVPEWRKRGRKERVTVFLSMSGLSPSDIQKINASSQKGERQTLATFWAVNIPVKNNREWMIFVSAINPWIMAFCAAFVVVMIFVNHHNWNDGWEHTHTQF